MNRHISTHYYLIIKKERRWKAREKERKALYLPMS